MITTVDGGTPPDGHGPGISVTFDKRVNIVSLANLAVLVGLLITALSTWYGLVAKVDLLNGRIDQASAELSRIRGDVQSSMAARDADVRSLRDKSETVVNRLSIVETQINGVVSSVQRIEQKLERDTPSHR